MITNIILYALLWFSFGFLHSVLSRTQAKKKLNHLLTNKYRVAFNLFALIHISIVLACGLYLFRDAASFVTAGWLSNICTLVLLLGFIIVLASLKQYDLGVFSGLTQLRNRPDNTHATPIPEQPGQHPKPEEPPEPLNTSGLNHFVRHPLYSGLFLMLWGNATSTFGLMTAVWGSLYLIIGTRFEERQLVRIYGQSYLNYQAEVPAYIPWRIK